MLFCVQKEGVYTDSPREIDSPNAESYYVVMNLLLF